MTQYHIPELYLKGFQKISKLSDGQAIKIADSLNSSEFGTNINKIGEVLSKDENFNQFEVPTLELIIKTIFSLLRIDDMPADEKQEKIENIIHSIITLSEPENDIDSDVLKNHLTIFLSISGRVKQTLKGRQLLRENEKQYVSSKLVTDVRVVFDDDLDNTEVRNAVIVHRVKIEFSENSEYKETYYAMDTNDLLELKKNIDRAMQKEKILRQDKGMQSLSFLSLEKSTDNK